MTHTPPQTCARALARAHSQGRTPAGSLSLARPTTPVSASERITISGLNLSVSDESLIGPCLLAFPIPVSWLCVTPKT